MCFFANKEILPAPLKSGAFLSRRIMGETVCSPTYLSPTRQCAPPPTLAYTRGTLLSRALRAGLARSESLSASSYHFFSALHFCSSVVKRIFLSA